MLQIRLSKGPSSDGGGGPARSAPPMETVTVACPEHLVIADLPVAKSVGVLTTAFASSGRNMGRRSRRQLGDRIHLCVRCDFPIAIYGRLIPCEHAFCLACARSDPSCYLCDERVQKIQTIKMLEGIFICAAPHCLKSFLKKAEFESHVHDTHADLLQLNVEKEGGSETNNNLNVARPTSADVQKQSSLPEVSTARAPLRSGFSPSSNSMLPDREDRVYRLPSRDQSYPRPPPQVRPPPFPSSQSHQPSDIPLESNMPQFSDRPYNWFPPPQRIDNQGSTQYQQDTDQFPLERTAGTTPESMFPSFTAQLPHQPNYPIHSNPHQPLITAPFNFPSFPADGSQPFFGAPVEMPRAESAPSEGGSDQGSVLGIPPGPTGVAGFRENYARPWGMDLMSMPFPPMPIVQAISDSFVNPADSQGGMAFFQGDFGQGLLNPASKESEKQSGSGNHIDSKSLLSTLPGQKHSSLPLPPPPPHPPPLSLQLNRTRFSASGDATREGQGTGWQNDKVRFGNWPD